jgi:hypothetical protein
MLPAASATSPHLDMPLTTRASPSLLDVPPPELYLPPAYCCSRNTEQAHDRQMFDALVFRLRRLPRGTGH